MPRSSFQVSPLSGFKTAGPPRPDVATAPLMAYGVVVDNVNVRVLLYAPVRSGSVEPIDCLMPIVTASLLAGPV